MDAAALERFADLIVGVGANVQPGQVVDIGSAVGKEDVTRALAASAYRRGAKFVDVTYYDPYVKHARVEHVDDENLEFIPPWHGTRVLELGREHGAAISLSGPAAPGLFDDLDQGRLGRDVYPRVKEWLMVTNEKTVNWSVAPGPTAGWAKLVYPDVEEDEALDRLWDAIFHVCRLDEHDAAQAWVDRAATLQSSAKRLTERRFDALHLEGPGTDLSVGLFPTSKWVGGGEKTADDVQHMPNVPTEEVFTTPDPERVDGTVAATMPLYAHGRVIEDIRVRFEGGRAVQIDAGEGADTLRALAEKDEGAARLGEIALVDGQGR
ncbi:MAG: aminopeptidase, partial [Actinobacteria bacterium]|nr:aminopeptidase [Actinomycetota bacterium]